MTQPDPPLTVDELVSTGGERDVLEAFLDLYRRVVIRKLMGVSAEQARLRLVPSLTTLAGVVKHLAAVEREWFQLVLAQRSYDEIGGVPHDDGWALGTEETVEDLIADYERACTQSRQVASGFELEDSVPHARLGRVSLRWIYIHMIEETARHAGHADVLREQTDGATGFDG
ncbi:hypothetical protein Raf01_42840 [Rugosimonospora africana]|uniref:Mini-circle protein n=2 Tax=Rugosimonospora africana TaxID=556532 RepID=A0A8J3QU49_9ACTN|nr:hypothetical protein Raf01_42840 [Rugosimonospora africana]